MNPKVSVVIATYNGAKTLAQTLKSILDQTYDNFELLIVDDGSTDGTVRVIESFDDKRIKFFSQKNSGSPAAPRNLALKKASGELIALCDQDDLWAKDKLEKLVAAYEKSENQSDIGILYSAANLIDEKDRVTGLVKVASPGFLGQKEANRLLLGGNKIIACSAVFTRTAFEKVGLLDETLVGVDDYDYWLRITEHFGILAVSESLCSWRVSENSLSGNKTKQYIETEKIFTKLGDKNEDQRVGHGKNIFRIISSALVEKKYEVAKEYLGKIQTYPKTKKLKAILALARVSKLAASVALIALVQVGRIRI